MDPTFHAILILAGTLFIAIVIILAILMPLFVFKIRNEIVKLNNSISVIDSRIVIIHDEVMEFMRDGKRKCT